MIFARFAIQTTAFSSMTHRIMTFSIITISIKMTNCIITLSKMTVDKIMHMRMTLSRMAAK